MKIEFVPREKQHSEYDWADFSNGEERIGKARCKIENDTITICSINIYPEWEGNGYGRDFVNYCKHHFQVVVADRVRPTAIGFWETMGFCNNHDGAWIFRKNRQEVHFLVQTVLSVGTGCQGPGNAER